MAVEEAEKYPNVLGGVKMEQCFSPVLTKTRLDKTGSLSESQLSLTFF